MQPGPTALCLTALWTLVALALPGAARVAAADPAAQPRAPDAGGPGSPSSGDSGNPGVPAAASEPRDGADAPADTSAATGPDDTAGEPTVIDFGDEEAFGPGEVVTGREADDVQFGTLLRARYRRLLEARDDGEPPPPPRPARLGVAVTTGVAIASLSGDVAGAGARIGGTVGVSATVRLAAGVGVDPGLWYEARGATLPDGGVLHYLTLPVLLRYRVSGGGYRLDLGAGPAAGLALSSRLADMEVRRWELGVVGSAGVSVPAGPGAVALAVRYERGLTEIAPASGVRNRVLAITAGYRF